MVVRASVTRSVKLPDSLRVARFERAPELGPKILFFSGGTALRPLSRVLKRYTHNSIHLITPFDSGGSSAALRRAFNMLSIGDLRNRLVALADESVRGNPEIYRLFCYRMSERASTEELAEELETMVAGTHDLVAAVPEPMRNIIKTHLRFFFESAPAELTLQGANVGNLLLTGGYVAHDRDIESTLFLFSKLLEVRGIVRPTADSEYHLAAELEDGSQLTGQHLLTAKAADPLNARISQLYLVSSLEHPTPVLVKVEEKVLRLIRKADLLVYPIGSFYTSVLANLLPSGVGQAIVAAASPKIYVPNAGNDPEQAGMSVADCVDALVKLVRKDAGSEAELERIVNMVLVDSRGQHGAELALGELQERGIQVLDVPILDENSGYSNVDPQKLTEVLLSLC